MTKHRFVDLFSGCGGLSLGLSLAGLEGQFAIERDPMAFETFAANFLGERKTPLGKFVWPSWLEEKAWAIRPDQHPDRVWGHLRSKKTPCLCEIASHAPAKKSCSSSCERQIDGNQATVKVGLSQGHRMCWRNVNTASRREHAAFLP
jgi:site-specific DNA-cytosine methylase